MIKESNEHKFKNGREQHPNLPPTDKKLSQRSRLMLGERKKKYDNNLKKINQKGQEIYNKLYNPDSKISIENRQFSNSYQQSSLQHQCDPIDPFESKESGKNMELGE